MRTLLTDAATRSAGGVLRSRRYKVVVKTSDIRGAGTDANVYLTMFGEGPDGKVTKSAEMKLENSSNNFERCKVSTGTVSIHQGHITLSCPPDRGFG